MDRHETVAQILDRARREHETGVLEVKLNEGSIAEIFLTKRIV